METVIEHIKIDDEFITNNNDPMAIINPVGVLLPYMAEKKSTMKALRLFPKNREMSMLYYGIWLK